MKTIFVSSTFKDFQRERDALRDRVLPQINAIAKEYGETVDFCDLRWGINTSELDSAETAHKVLSVCLDEIDRCSPPMIVILGYRYGWIPDNPETMATELKKRSLDLEDLEISVTALEIEYGGLSSDKKRNNTLFYFREIENAPTSFFDIDNISYNKLKSLKERIISLSKGKVKSYHVVWQENQTYDVERFINTVRDDIISYYLPQWKELLEYSPTRVLIKTNFSLIENKASHFFPRNILLDSCMNILRNRTYLIIRGDSGSGKSMLLSKIATIYAEDGWQIAPIMCGSASASTALDVLITVVNMLEELLNKEVIVDYHKLERSYCLTSLYNLCDEIRTKGKKILIAIDAVDQLLDDEDRKLLIFFPNNLNENVKLVMTTQPDIDLYDLNSVETTRLSEDEKNCFIEGFSSCFRKELDPAVVSVIVNKREANNPLYLSLLLQRLTMMNREDYLYVVKSGDSIDAIIEKQINIIETSPTDLKRLCTALFDEVGKRINPILSKEILKYISFSRSGLRPADLQVLTGDLWNYLDFSLLTSFLNDSFIIHKDGRIDLSHQIIKSSIVCQYNQEESLDIHKCLYDYFDSLDDADEIKLNEIGFHCIKSGDCQSLLSLIKNGLSNKLFMEILAKDTYKEYISTSTDIIYRICDYLHECGETNVDMVAKFVIHDVLPLFNRFSSFEVYRRLNLLQGFSLFVQTGATTGEIPSIILAFLTALSNGDIFFDFSRIADFKEHDDNEDTNRRKAIEFYQKFGLKYLSMLEGKIGQDEYLFYASLYNRAMEEASIFESVKLRYLTNYLGNLTQINKKKPQQNLDLIFGFARRAFYASISNSIFTQLYIKNFEELIGAANHKLSPENVVEMAQSLYYIAIACYVTDNKMFIDYLQKSMDQIDELNIFGLSSVLSFKTLKLYSNIVELILAYVKEDFFIKWIQAHITKIFNIINNLYQKDRLLELAETAIRLYYNLELSNICPADLSVEKYKNHIISDASLNNNAMQFIKNLAEIGCDDLLIEYKLKQKPK